MNVETSSFIVGLVSVTLFDWYLIYKYGYPSLSILITKLYFSKNFKWLTYNVFGKDNRRFYIKVKLALEEK